MKPIDELDPDYGMSTSMLCGAHRAGSITTSQLLAKATEAAADLEARGVAWSECWRNDRDWQMLGRIGLINATVSGAMHDSFNIENSDRWRERKQRQKSIKLVR